MLLLKTARFTLAAAVLAASAALAKPPAPPPEKPAPADPADTPEEQLLRDAMGPDLQAALDALPEAFREAVWLRDVEEFPYAEIAQMLDVPLGTVMSRISRGRRMLYDSMVRKKVEPAQPENSS